MEGEHPYVWLDATFHKVRELGRVVSVLGIGGKDPFVMR